jgi:hypothetical protein
MTDATPRSRIVSAAAAMVTFLAGIAAVTLAVHVAFVVLDANPRNSAVEFFGRLADRLAPGFRNLFHPDGVKQRVVLNYGLAALGYLVAGQIVSRLIRRAE